VTAPPYQHHGYDGDEADAITAEAAADSEKVVCEICGSTFANTRGLAIHIGRSHAAKTAKPAKPRTKENSHVQITADRLRELAGKLDRIDELRAELAELEQEIAAAGIKAWQR
jgi:hypothetical protein